MILSGSEAMRMADAETINSGAASSEELMLRAGGHLARAAAALCPEGGRVCVFCGSGNNGGDGVCASEMLISRYGLEVRALLVGSRSSMSADCRLMERRLAAAGGALEDYDPEDGRLREYLRGCGVIIDAVFGIGLNRAPAGRAAAAIELMNSSGVPVISADIPSGVEADTGLIPGAAVRAALTLTFSMAKPAHFIEPGCVNCGRVEVCGIGIPDGILARCNSGVETLDGAAARLDPRRRLSHKGDYGRLMIVGGSVGYSGAPCICAQAAVRSGAGLVYLGVPEPLWSIAAAKLDEAMPFPLPSENGAIAEGALDALLPRLAGCDTLVLGPGLGRGADAMELVLRLVESFRGRLVLDADALYAVSLHPECLLRAAHPPVLTPHEGEFVRLGGSLDGGRLSGARGFAAKWRCILVLKGHRTLVAYPDGRVLVCLHGNAGMAKGGSGDALAGVVGALLGQYEAERAVALAVNMHALAGDICAERLGEYSMCASDLVNTLSEATKYMLKQE